MCDMGWGDRLAERPSFPEPALHDGPPFGMLSGCLEPERAGSGVLVNGYLTYNGMYHTRTNDRLRRLLSLPSSSTSLLSLGAELRLLKISRHACAHTVYRVTLEALQ
jgi:hypothetical protein